MYICYIYTHHMYMYMHAHKGLKHANDWDNTGLISTEPQDVKMSAMKTSEGPMGTTHVSLP